MPKPNLSAHPTEVVKPDDFDQFWQEIMEEVDSIPLNVSIELDSLRSNEEVEGYEVKYDSLDGLRIAGWYCLPRERKLIDCLENLLQHNLRLFITHRHWIEQDGVYLLGRSNRNGGFACH